MPKSIQTKTAQNHLANAQVHLESLEVAVDAVMNLRGAA
ncbi:hypothetical protein SFB21_0188 [Acinetobacter bouvetii]|uniref:Uncharacterized protein n=1 Tax=Acinetobacter bouvetii TaxID=202951 RepID=A0A811G865_9GAMM|nr:hypothetical protein SFB21_0188 [Acinetobacter bouvetii]